MKVLNTSQIFQLEPLEEVKIHLTAKDAKVIAKNARR